MIILHFEVRKVGYNIKDILLLMNTMLLPDPQPTLNNAIHKKQSLLLLLSQHKVTIDYVKLCGFLAMSKWKEANQETEQVMLKVAEREEEGWLDYEDIKNFPYSDLCLINQLWVHASDGRFGFSVQKRIYQKNCKLNIFEDEACKKFGKEVGWYMENKWLKYPSVVWNIEASLGHLPFFVSFFMILTVLKRLLITIPFKLYSSFFYYILIFEQSFSRDDIIATAITVNTS